MSITGLMGWDADSKVWRKVVVNADGKLIIDPSEIFEDPPTDGEVGKAATSNWSHDHAADASAHHVKYTDAEARSAIGNIIDSVGRFVATIFCNYNWFNDIAGIKMTSDISDCDVLFLFKSNAVSALKIYNYRAGIGPIATDMYIYDGNNYQVVATYPVVDSKIATHTAIAAAHHARYTDAEAMMSRYNNRVTLTAGTYTAQDVTGKGLLILDTVDGNINLKGLSGGATGQMIYCLKTNLANTLVVYHNSSDAAAGNRLWTSDCADNQIGVNRVGGFWIMYMNGGWYVDRVIP